MTEAAKQFKPRVAATVQHGGKSPDVYARCRVYRTKAWKKLRFEVLVRDGMVCQQCQRIILQPGEAHVDHIVEAKSEAEVLCSIDNLRTLCVGCHSKRTMRSRNIK